MTAVLNSIIANILRFVLIASLGWLLKQNIVDANQSSTITAFFQAHSGEVASFLSMLIFTAVWKGWAWLQHFKFISGVEAAAGLPVTGTPNAATIQVVQKLADVALVSPLTPPTTPAATSPVSSAALILPILAFLFLVPVGCADLPPKIGAAPTHTQETISGDLDAVASAIRHAESADMTPAEFDAFLEKYVALLPLAQPYIKDAELAYEGLDLGEGLTVSGLEELAARYDS